MSDLSLMLSVGSLVGVITGFILFVYKAIDRKRQHDEQMRKEGAADTERIQVMEDVNKLGENFRHLKKDVHNRCDKIEKEHQEFEGKIMQALGGIKEDISFIRGRMENSK